MAKVSNRNRSGKDAVRVMEENYIGIRSLFQCNKKRFENDAFSIAAIDRLNFFKDKAIGSESEYIEDLIEDIEEFIFLQRSSRVKSN